MTDPQLAVDLLFIDSETNEELRSFKQWLLPRLLRKTEIDKVEAASGSLPDRALLIDRLEGLMESEPFARELNERVNNLPSPQEKGGKNLFLGKLGTVSGNLNIGDENTGRNPGSHNSESFASKNTFRGTVAHVGGDVNIGDRISSVGKTANHTPSAEVKNLAKRKLIALERERILATDASVRFKLDEEIEELKQQLK